MGMPHSEEWKAKWKPPKIRRDGSTIYGWRVIHPKKLIIGRYVDIGSFTLIVATHTVAICEGTEIGSHCSIYSENSEDGTHGLVFIGEHVRIGSHTTILPNVVVHSGAVIGAYSLVKSDIPPDSLAYGIPAKVVRHKLKSSERET